MSSTLPPMRRPRSVAARRPPPAPTPTCRPRPGSCACRELMPDVRLFDLRFTDPELAASFTFRPGPVRRAVGARASARHRSRCPPRPTRRGLLPARHPPRRDADRLPLRPRPGGRHGRHPRSAGQRLPGRAVRRPGRAAGRRRPRHGARCAACCSTSSTFANDFGRVILLYGSRQPGPGAVPRRARVAGRRGDAEILLTRRLDQRPALGRRGGRRHRAARRGRARRRAHLRRRLRPAGVLQVRAREAGRAAASARTASSSASSGAWSAASASAATAPSATPSPACTARSSRTGTPSTCPS